MVASATAGSGLVTPSERGRADDDDQFGVGRALVDEPMRQLPVNLDAVAGVQLVGPTRDLGEDVATQHDRALLAGVWNRRWRRCPARRQRQAEHFELADRVRRYELVLDVALGEADLGAAVMADDDVAPVGPDEELEHRDPEGLGDATERADRWIAGAALDLAQRADRQADLGRKLRQGQTAPESLAPDALAD